MAEFVTLIGADDVARAGSAMREAAAEITRAASAIEYAMSQHQRHIEDWLARF